MTMNKGDKQSRERMGPHLAALCDGTIAAASSSGSEWRRNVVVTQDVGNCEVGERRTQDNFRIGLGLALATAEFLREQMRDMIDVNLEPKQLSS
jgi:hypothetical protein